MNHLRIANLILFVISVCARCNIDAAEPKRPIPDIVGEWVCDSPLDSFVQDDSLQPVNKFEIRKSRKVDFDARYLGSNATSVGLKWIEESQRFEGTKSDRGNAKFVVTPTDDPNVLTCEIASNQLLNGVANIHKDKWTRVRVEPSAPNTPGSNPTDTKERAVADVKQEKEKTDQPADKTSKTILRYEDHADFTPELKANVEELMSEFLPHLTKLGFKLQKGQVAFRVQPGMNNAHYYHTNRSIVIDLIYVGTDTILCREYTHHALAVSLGENQKEIFERCSGIESGLADYFGCSFGDDTNACFERKMENNRKFTEISDSSERHDVGEVLCGALWEIRGSTERIDFDRLLVKAWVGLVKSDASSGQVIRFATSLLNVAEKEKPEYAQKIRTVFEGRGLTIPAKGN